MSQKIFQVFQSRDGNWKTRFRNYVVSSIWKYSLEIIGLWPHLSKSKRRMNYALFCVSSVLLMICLVGGILEDENTDRIIISENIFCLTFLISVSMSFTMIIVEDNKWIKFHQKMINERDSLINEVEIEILDSTIRKAMIDVFIFTCCGFPAISVFCITALWNICKEKHDSYPYYSKHLIIHESVKIYQTSIHAILVPLYGSILIISFISLFAYAVGHVRGIYNITREHLTNQMSLIANFPPNGHMSTSILFCHEFLSGTDKFRIGWHTQYSDYRLQNVIRMFKREILVNPSNDETSLISNLIDTIHQHRKATEGVKDIGKIFSIIFFISQLGETVIFAIVLYNLNYSSTNLLQILRMFIMSVGHIIFSFLLNLAGQKLRETEENVLLNAYSIDWFLLPTQSRRLFIILQYRCCRFNKIPAGFSYELSLENFSGMMQTAWKIGTVLISAQKSRSNI